METYIIPLAAIIIAAGTLIFTALSIRSKADGGYVDQLERRVERLESALKECHHERDKLQRENIELMRKLVSSESKR